MNQPRGILKTLGISMDREELLRQCAERKAERIQEREARAAAEKIRDEIVQEDDLQAPSIDLEARRVEQEEASLVYKITRANKLLASLEAEIESKKHELVRLRTDSNLPGATLLPEDDIVAAQQPMPKSCGIYFLMKEDRVVYVGQSVNVFARVGQHFNDKDVDGFAWMPCEKEALDAMESLYIYALDPELNGHNRGGRRIAPIQLDDIFEAAESDVPA